MDQSNPHQYPTLASTGKSRKSVSFTPEKEVIEASGSVINIMATDDGKITAVSHTPRTPTLATHADGAPYPATNDSDAVAAVLAAGDTAADEAGLDLKIKKKKKKKKLEDDVETGAAASAAPAVDDDAAPAPADDGGLDLTMKKRRKNKVDDDFTAKLKALAIDGGHEDGKEAGAVPGGGADGPVNEGDMTNGTGLWAHNEARPISYDLLLGRFFVLLSLKHPDHALSGSRSYKIPPPQCLREGNKKTIFTNLAEICKRMKRSEDHVTAYLFAELGTNGSTDGGRRLVIKGRFQQKQIEAVLRTYIIEYVTCITCKSGDTELSKGENRLYFITCNLCGSRRSVLAIKAGFSAQVGRRKKMQG